MSIHVIADRPGTRLRSAAPFGATDLTFDFAPPRRPECVRFLGAWRAGRPGAPAADEPAAGNIAALLPHTFLVERTIQGWRFRQFGSALVEQVGIDLTGRLVADVFVPGAADALSHLFHSVAWRRAAVGVAGRWGSAEAAFGFECVAAPLANPGGWSAALLGCLSAWDDLPPTERGGGVAES